jgi:hypothetical protein
MKFHLRKYLILVPTLLMLSVAIPGYGNSYYDGETGDNGNRKLQIANYLNERKQVIDNWINAIENANNIGNPSLANQYKPVACTNSLLFQADLQKRVINGEISSDNENLKLLKERIQYLHELANCSN